MKRQLGEFIVKKPWVVVLVVVVATIGFSLFLPSLEFKTDFASFAPDDEYVRANNRISEYFGMNQQVMFILVQKQQQQSTITPQSLRAQYLLQKELQVLPEINSTISITTFIETICLLEFNKTLENCTDSELETAIHDLLFQEQQNLETTVFSTDDKNEPVDFLQKKIFSKQKSIDSADIKNVYLIRNNDTLIISFEVYDLSFFKQKLAPSLPNVHAMEWYLEFTNLISPVEELKMQYQLTARIEPLNPYWEFGKGVRNNLQSFLSYLRSKTLFNTYTKQSYLWLKPYGQEMFFPMKLTTSNITFYPESNRIEVSVSASELGSYGIAPRFGTFELPGKLSNFSAGVRYYQSPLLHRPAAHTTINTSALFDRLNRLQARPLLGKITNRFLGYLGLSEIDLDSMSDMDSQFNVLPDTVSFRDMMNTWTNTDVAPDQGVSDIQFSLFPRFYEDLKVNAVSFISTDYKETRTPHASLIIVQMDSGTSLEDIVQINEKIIDKIQTLDVQTDTVSFEVTGESVISAQIEQVTMEANTVIGPLIFVFIIIILFSGFRKPSYVFLPVLVFAFSSIWLFGTMALLGIEFSVIAVALLPLNIGLGVEYAVNLLHNYRVEVSRGKSSADAIRVAIRDTGTAIFLAWATTFTAFLSFLSATLPPIRDFGIFLALGITYTFVITITLLPAVRYIVDRKKPLSIIPNQAKISLKIVLGRVAVFVLRHEKLIFALTLLISLVMVVSVTQLETGFSMEQFIPADTPALEVFDRIAADFPFSSQDQEFILFEGTVASVDGIRSVADTLRSLEDNRFVSRKSDGSIKTEDMVSIIRQAVQRNETLQNVYAINPSTGFPDTNQNVVLLLDYLFSSPEYMMQIQNVVHKEGDQYTATVIRVYIDASFQTTNGDMTNDLSDLKNGLNQAIETYGDITAIITGNYIITFTITSSLTESQLLATGFCFILAAIMLSLIYRNPILGLIAMIPVSISILWVLGSMYFVGYTLNIMTIMVTSITIGVGIDYAVYVTERFRLVADRTGDPKKAVCETISRTGNAILLAALSSMFGFGILMFAPIPPQQQFGLITALTLIYAFLTSIIILPLVLARWANWRKKRKGYIVSLGKPRDWDESDMRSDDFCE